LTLKKKKPFQTDAMPCTQSSMRKLDPKLRERQKYETGLEIIGEKTETVNSLRKSVECECECPIDGETKQTE